MPFHKKNGTILFMFMATQILGRMHTKKFPINQDKD